MLYAGEMRKDIHTQRKREREEKDIEMRTSEGEGRNEIEKEGEREEKYRGMIKRVKEIRERNR